ncbi:hypoxanthine phosphoribosyltransferase [Cruoricaptor ignavus]|uniref:Hypoxanthine phosphoribosyltransferase n=2 Tax=Cruoricaptor ignavus TaxID=1118202 RepID=A0A1M6GJ54_9FLAO|nr:hypoxanthine phosphoribosyltransferase [Cruoricaptor ignavus]
MLPNLQKMAAIQVHDKHFVPFISSAEIQDIVKDVALRIFEDFKDETPVFIGVLNGVVMFFSDLIRHYPGPCEIAFLQMSSYIGTQSTGIVYQKMELTKDIRDRHIIIVEDIVDTGNTVENLFKYFEQTQRPKSVKLATFLLKPEVYKKDFKLDYVGWEIPNKFVVGYGLDYDELGRNLPELYQLSEGKIND